VISAFLIDGDSNNVNATCRWQVADTSANTGGYNYLRFAQMQTNLQRVTRKQLVSGGFLLFF